MLPSGRELYDMTVSGRAKTQTGLCWVWVGDGGIGDAERPGSEHHGWEARIVRRHWVCRSDGDWPSGPVAMSRIGTLAENKYSSHAVPPSGWRLWTIGF